MNWVINHLDTLFSGWNMSLTHQTMPRSSANNDSIWCLCVCVCLRRDRQEDRNDKDHTLRWFGSLSQKYRSILCVWNDLMHSFFSNISTWRCVESRSLSLLPSSTHTGHVLQRSDILVGRLQKKNRNQMFCSALLFQSAKTSRTNEPSKRRENPQVAIWG